MTATRDASPALLQSYVPTTHNQQKFELPGGSGRNDPLGISPTFSYDYFVVAAAVPDAPPLDGGAPLDPVQGKEVE